MEKSSNDLLLFLRDHSIPLALYLVAGWRSPFGLAHLPINIYIAQKTCKSWSIPLENLIR